MKLTLLTYELYIPGCRSLKEKRREIKGLKDSLRSRLNVSVAEVDYLDKWQRSVLAIAWVEGDAGRTDRTSSAIDGLINSRAALEIIGFQRTEY